jgi:hypothetical protein
MTTTLTPYIDAIQTVRTKQSHADLSSQQRSLQIQTHPSSNTKKPVVRFVLDNKLVTRNNDLLIGYKCLRCGVNNEITLNLYLRKVSKHVQGCNACKNMDPQKRADQTAFMLGQRPAAEKAVKWSSMSLQERLQASTELFSAEDTGFQTAYFARHMTEAEFERIRGKLLSVGNGKRTSLAEWEYFPYYRVGNQTKYTPMLVHRGLNQIEKPAYVQWSCEECETRFTNRDLEVQKNRIRMLCADCGFCNRTFKVRSLITQFGKVRYQSIQERRWIEWCTEQGIEVANGPRISYTFQDRVHVYNVDFQIPSVNTLVELKDNHVWHKRQIESGKWGKKEEAARAWAASHGWTYEMVFPKTLSKWKEDILVRYSLTLQETVRSKDKEPCENIGGNL